jgi:alcohol dehydrogenase class IV
LYGIPHGLANAVVLPYVLEAYGSCIYPKLARLARIAGTGNKDETEEQLAEGFISSIRKMNSAMNIPLGFSEIAGKDITLIVERVLKEANPGYPVPRIIDGKECTEIIGRLMSNR